MKSMAEVTDILHDATKNLSEQQKLETENTIFGSDAMRTAGAISELTGAQFQTMSDTMKNTDAQVVAAQRMDNFKGSMDQLKGSIDTVMIQIGMEMIPTLTKLTNWLTNEGIPGLQAFTAENQKTFDDIEAVLKATFDVLIPLADASLKSVLAPFLVTFDAIEGGVKVMKGIVHGDFELFLDGLEQMAMAPLKGLERIFMATWDAIDKITDGGLTDLANTVIGGMNAVIGTVEGGTNELIGDVRFLFEQMKAAADAFPLANPLGNAMQEAIDQMHDVTLGRIPQIREDMALLGENAMAGIEDGWIRRQSDLYRIIWETGNQMTGSMKQALDARSPSGVFAEIGEDTIQGLIDGLEGRKAWLIATLEGIAQVMAASLNPETNPDLILLRDNLKPCSTASRQTSPRPSLMSRRRGHRGALGLSLAAAVRGLAVRSRALALRSSGATSQASRTLARRRDWPPS